MVFMDRFAKVAPLLLIPPVCVRIAMLTNDCGWILIAAVL